MTARAFGGMLLRQMVAAPVVVSFPNARGATKVVWAPMLALSPTVVRDFLPVLRL